MRAPLILSLFFCPMVVVEPARAQPACIPGSLPFADFDQRGDVSLDDYETFSMCLSGPGEAPAPESPQLQTECLDAFDADEDGDVDAKDFVRFQREFTGECVGIGECPSGTHLEHRSGQVGLVQLDGGDDPNGQSDIGEPAAPPEPPSSVEYRCVPDESCADVDCSGRGDCEVHSGKAVCACDPGYAGGACEVCATGYEFVRDQGCVLGSRCAAELCSGSGDCRDQHGEIVCDCDDGFSGDHCQFHGLGKLVAPVYIEIDGTDRSIEHGEVRQICATVFGGKGDQEPLTWSMEGPGGFSAAGQCLMYVAPQVGGPKDTEMVELRVCSQRFPDHCAVRYLAVDPVGAVRSTGQSHAALKPFDDMIRQYMLRRCIGGAVVGVSVFGKPVFVRGYGNISGAPTNDPAYLEACGDTFNVANAVPGIPLPPPSEVQPNTPFRIGSISKSVAAALLRKAVKEEVTASDTDANIEAVRLCDGILPPAMHAVACLNQPPPLMLDSLSGSPPNCASSNPCPYGGTCVVTNEASQTGHCDGCPAGRTGLDCSRLLANCPHGEVDDRWADVTLGHLLGHTAGLPRSVPSLFSVILPGMEYLRGLLSESDWADEEDTLTAEGDWPNGNFDAQFPAFPAAKATVGPGNYLIRRPTVDEAVLARMGACLAAAPGSSTSYSNTGFALLGPIMEAITGRHVSGKTGQPDLHTGSLLEEFAADQLGLPIAGQGTARGIFYSQDTLDLRDPKEPIWRAWSTVTNSYYKPVNDEKRPYCEWSEGSSDCHFNDWIDGDHGFNWNFAEQDVLVGYQGASFGGPSTAGALSTEAEVFLRFMSKYWVGGDGSNPRYGETRCPDGNCIWTLATGHNGARDGTYAEAKQLGGPVKPSSQGSCVNDSDCPVYTACNGTDQEDNSVQQFCRGGKCWQYNEYGIPPIDAGTGQLSEDFGDKECRRCRLPVGVDIFVALNQKTDKKCREAESLNPGDPDYYTCKAAYGMLADIMLHAACQVQWPPNPWVLWPPVFENGGSSMLPEFAGP